MAQRLQFRHNADGTLDIDVTDLDEQLQPLKTVRYFNCTPVARHEHPEAESDAPHTMTSDTEFLEWVAPAIDGKSPKS